MALKATKTSPGQTEGRAYLRLADTIRRQILDGTYRPGERIPTENGLSRATNLSPLTVRQALGLLVDEGLLERFIGRGTFVKRLDWQKATFSIDGLIREISQPGAKVRVIRTEVRHAPEKLAQTFGLQLGDQVIYLKRTISSSQNVFLVQESHLKPDFRRPIMEAELEATYLSGLIQGEGRGLIKYAELSVTPSLLSTEDASLLWRTQGEPAFRLDYVFFDAQVPLAVGFFTIPSGILKFTASVGVRPPNAGTFGQTP
ncbi:MAG: GntR family transcriptional regulator [Deltaproteobacteria bacterium]|jgi:GntR family transcriptional regulator|nr:GntR family transcriptional regulator [Deltaproteobacteria bacterium]